MLSRTTLRWLTTMSMLSMPAGYVSMPPRTSPTAPHVPIALPHTLSGYEHSFPSYYVKSAYLCIRPDPAYFLTKRYFSLSLGRTYFSRSRYDRSAPALVKYGYRASVGF